MIVSEPGLYRWIKDGALRGANCIWEHHAGSEFRVTQIDRAGRKIWSPSFPDWQYWDQPCEPIGEMPAERERKP